jgi:pimeloyl-ACP methyl ester carboxylesterase
MSSAGSEIQEATICGHRGRFLQLGQGPSVLLVASQLVRIQPYRPLFLRLAERFHVTVLELPGCGGASKLGDGWNCEDYAHWLRQFLEQERLHRPVVIAHSTSSGAAIRLAARNPHLLSGLILTGSIGIPRSFLSILLGRALDAFIEWRLSLSRWFDIAHTALFHTQNFFHQIRIAAGDDLTQTARRITIPTLLAHGRRDHTVPLSSANTLHQLIPNSQLYISPAGSHDWLITHPGEFTDMTRSFASSIESDAIAVERFTPSPLRSPIRR